jgi:uncharacterized protein (TIGR02145 family)
MYLEGSLGLTVSEQQAEGFRGLNQANVLKSINYWAPPNSSASNSTGFTAIPGGTRNVFGNFTSLGTTCFVWSSTEFQSLYAYYRSLNYTNSNINRGALNREGAYSVRCLKD